MIRGERVTLRPIQPGDIALLRLWQSDPAVMTGWALPSPLVAHDAFEADLNGRFREFEEAGYFIIEVDCQPTGRISFNGFDERHRTAELALYIGESSALGKGHAQDAVAALARYLFDERKAARIELTVIESNARARRVYEAVGFVTEGILRDHVHFGGQYQSEILMALYGPEMIRTRAAL